MDLWANGKKEFSAPAWLIKRHPEAGISARNTRSGDGN